ncbi:hypothetical protein F511_18861 [Dorcoceras hygrometricum]|uniref:Uncharacterized protein n=1 Tax=Dorcoceras hygrometricum TaxID=472368 RepID=A0A2Z7AD71_9LAMI|nr:hypothetical protein F511_18861 [Dorcoceras hygrometricum]
MGEVSSYQLPSIKRRVSSRLYVGCPNAKKPMAKADISSHLIRCNTDLRRASEP